MKNTQPSINRVRRNEKILKNLETNQIITPEGGKWLMMVLDPFHDTKIDRPVGWPDGNNNPSVIRCVKQSMTIESPDGSGYDTMISVHPLLNHRVIVGTKSSFRSQNMIVAWNGAESGYDGNTYDSYFLNVDSYPVNANVSEMSYEYVNPGANTGFQLPTNFCGGPGRLVAAGFEVHNVTEEIYRSGTVTVGRAPQVADPFTAGTSWKTLFATTPASYDIQTTPFTAVPLTPRPNRVAEAMLYDGTLQWEARDGCYVVIPFQSEANPATTVDYSQPWLTNVSTKDTVVATNVNSVGVVPLIEAGSGFPANKWAPVTSSFALFTGLSPQTKLTVNLIMYYETFPSVLDDVVTLASPSIPYDPHALQLYKHCLMKLPAGVPVAMNGLGDWFAMAVSEFSDMAGLGLSALGVPFAVQMASGAKRLADTYIKNNAEKKPASTTAAYQARKKKDKQKAKAKERGVPMPRS